jgi:hypothetical protein
MIIFDYMSIKMENTALKGFIKERSSLFWYTPEEKKEEISDELLVETILNYGTLDDIRELVRIMGKEKVSEIFFNASGRKKLNYYPEIHNFFTLVFSRDA